jgi:hypothetical protein
MELQQISDVEKMSFVPIVALIVHELSRNDDKERAHSASDIPSTYVTLHRIEKGDLCEGRPITRKKLIKLCDTVTPLLSGPPAFIPDHVIAYSPVNATLMWW